MNTFSFRPLPPQRDDGRRARQQDPQPEQRPSRAGQPGDEHRRRPLPRRVDGDQHRTASIPRINFTPGTIGSDITSDLLEDGSFVRLRSVTLDCPLPDALLSRVRRRRTRASTSPASNWKTWTHYSGFNPDVSSLGIGNVNRGIDVGAYPLAKSVTFGINISY